MRTIVLTLAVMLALTTALSAGSAQGGLYDVHLSVAIDPPGAPLAPGESAWAIVEVQSSCSLFPQGTPSSGELDGIERIFLTVKTTDGDLSATPSATEFVIDHDARDCTPAGHQAFILDTTLKLLVDPNAPAHQTMAVVVTAESSWAPGREVNATAAITTGSVGGLNATAPPAILATDGTGTATITVTNEMNVPLAVRPDATLRTLFGPQPEILPFTLEVGETRVLDVPLRVEDAAGATGALEVRFDVAAADDPSRAFAPVHLRVPVDVGGGPAPLAMDVAESPLPPVIPLLTLLAAVGLALRRRS